MSPCLRTQLIWIHVCVCVCALLLSPGCLGDDAHSHTSGGRQTTDSHTVPHFCYRLTSGTSASCVGWCTGPTRHPTGILLSFMLKQTPGYKLSVHVSEKKKTLSDQLAETLIRVFFFSFIVLSPISTRFQSIYIGQLHS